MADASGSTITVRVADGEPVGLTRVSRASVDEPPDYRGGADESQTHTPTTTPGIRREESREQIFETACISRSGGLAHRRWIALQAQNHRSCYVATPRPRLNETSSWYVKKGGR